MFERFTDRTRRVVVLAQEEARLLGHGYIGTEHILLGLLHEREGIAAQALESFEIGLEAAREQTVEILSERKGNGRRRQPPSGHIPFTPRAKKVLELSLRESLQLSHRYIDTEHILLGLLRAGDGVAVQVLARLGADLNAIRRGVIRLAHDQPEAEPEAETGTGAWAEAAAAPGPARPAPPGPTEQALREEVERLRALLRQHGIDPS